MTVKKASNFICHIMGCSRCCQIFALNRNQVGDERYAEEFRKALTSEEIKNIKHGLGSVNQFIDSDSQLNNLFLCRQLKKLYA